MDNPTPEKPKRKRGPRRDFKKTVEGVEAYCLATIDIVGAQLPTDFGKGMISFAESVLKKVTNGK